MSQTSESKPNSDAPVEKVRKVFVRDVKNGAMVNTVFRVTDKERHTSRSGKTFLSLTLFDKTGSLDARIFDNVDAAEGAFNDDDYLLVSGKVAPFHGKPQLVVDRLERLDPAPIDAREFTRPLPEPPPVESHRLPKPLRQKLLAIMDDPQVSAGIEALVKHLERYIDERIAERTDRGDRGDRKSRPPRQENKKPEDPDPTPPRQNRDGNIPKDMAFKPFNTLAPEPESSAETPAQNSQTPSSGS